MLHTITSTHAKRPSPFSRRTTPSRRRSKLNLTAKIARLAGDLTGCDVLEIGPGPGGLTRGLLAEGARRVLAVEKDDRCLPALAEIAEAYPGRLQVIGGAGRRTASGCATDTHSDEKLSVSFAIADTAAIVTGMKARP